MLNPFDETRIWRASDKVHPQLRLGDASVGRSSTLPLFYGKRVCVADGADPRGQATYHIRLGTHDVAERLLERAIQHVIQLLRNGHRVLLWCHEGKERSPTVAAAALALHEDHSLEEGVKHVRSARPMVEPTDALLETARTVVARHSST